MQPNLLGYASLKKACGVLCVRLHLFEQLIKGNEIIYRMGEHLRAAYLPAIGVFMIKNMNCR